jgi:hypothetical protein
MSTTTATETAAAEYPRLPTIRSRVTDFPQCTFPSTPPYLSPPSATSPYPLPPSPSTAPASPINPIANT